ncbi:MAG: hypothetical protein JNK85_13340 [Verrucomicrobiales bacterium]|nr:hypothetical protein [Verrucomicrobiales bacterium]
MKHPRSVQWAEFSPDNRFVLTGCDDGMVRLWDASNGDPMSAPIPSGHHVRIARFSPGRDQILTASEEGILRLRKLPLHAVARTDWQAVAALNAGSQVTPDGEAVPLTAMELSALFHQVRSQNQKPVGK